MSEVVFWDDARLEESDVIPRGSAVPLESLYTQFRFLYIVLVYQALSLPPSLSLSLLLFRTVSLSLC